MKNELPRFRSIDPATIEPAIQSLLEDSRAEVREVLERVGSDGASWDQLVAHLEDIDDRLEKAWAPISHLNAVLSSDDLRQAHDACLPMLAEYATEMGQSRPLFDAYRSLEGEAGLDRAQQKVVTNALRDFRLAGSTSTMSRKRGSRRSANGFPFSRVSSVIVSSMRPMPGGSG